MQAQECEECVSVMRSYLSFSDSLLHVLFAMV